ncbi:MAG TPA: lipid A deacylase LpxR family protein [Bacteroidales bacterium]
MTKFYIHIIMFLTLAVWLASCSDSGNLEQNNEVEKEIATAKKGRLPHEIYSVKKHPKRNVDIQEILTVEENYTTVKKEKISERVESEFSEIVSKDIRLKNTFDKSIVQRKTKQQNSIAEKSWILTVIFDNDIFANTDYYYTNGARIELVTPFADNSPVNKILPGAGKSSTNFSGFSLQQNIYTPINPDAGEIQYNDRPFSAFLTIGQFRESVNIQKKINLKSEVSVGIVGPASLGGTVQSSIHDIEPVGWQNQVKNDFVLNYSLQFEKGIISNRNIEINATANGNMGTLFNKAGAGFYMRAGSFMPVYRGSLSAISGKKTNQPLQYWFFVRGNADAILYDATLQGGLFNDENPYTISQNSISRIVYGGSAGVALYYKQVGIELENFYLSPEFSGARHFMYGRIKLTATF